VLRRLLTVLPLPLLTLLAACAGAPPADEVSSVPTVTEAAGAPARAALVEPYELVLAIDLGPLPDGSGPTLVEVCLTVVGERSRYVVDTPAGAVVDHVMTADEHWWWIIPEARETVVRAEWIHFDVAAVEAAGATLPAPVAEARARLPTPAEVRVGDLLAGGEVLAVETRTPGEARLRVEDVPVPVVLRRRVLPATTTVEIPEAAVDVRDLADALVATWPAG